MGNPNIINLVEHIRREVEREVNDRLPRKVGITAKNHFTQNFRDGGFRDGGLHPWQPTRRQTVPGGADSRYGPLTSSRNHLMRSTDYRAAPGLVTIVNPVPYAALHNEGGTVHTAPEVTPRMRRFAWAMYYKSGDDKWRALALTRKTRLNITARIPQRQFIGPSAELTRKIDQMIHESIEKIKHGIPDF